MRKKKAIKAIAAIVILIAILLIIIIKKNNNDREAKESQYKQSIILQLGYLKLCEYSGYTDLADEKEIYFEEMLKDPNLQEKLEIAFDLLDKDCKKYNKNIKFEPVTLDRIKNSPYEVREEMADVFYYLTNLRDEDVITYDDPVSASDYMKLAEDQLKKCDKYIEWDEELAGKTAFLNFCQNEISEIESTSINEFLKGKKLEEYKKKAAIDVLLFKILYSEDYEELCERYERAVESKQMGDTLEKFEKIMQEENPEIGYGTDYELITTDRLLNDYESVYDELTGEMSDKLDEKYETENYLSTLFYRIVSK